MRRIFSFCLVIIIIFSSLGIVSYADNEINNNSNIDFLKMMGILEIESVDGTEALSRMELAKMYYKIITGNKIPEYTDYESSYTDVTENEYAYIKTVSEAGIMTGVSQTVFGTSQNVTYIQLLKTVVTLLGYESHARASGGWPAGYYSVAAKLGLTQNPPSDMNYYVTFNGAADVLRLAADADMVIRTDYGEDETYINYDGFGFLEYYMHTVPFDGIVTATSTVSLDDDSVCEFGEIRIGNETMNVSAGAIGIYKLIGQRVTVFCDKRDSKKEIRYYEALANNVLHIDGDNIEAIDGNNILYSDGNREEKLKFSPSTSIIYNGTLAKNYTDTTLNPFRKNHLDGELIAIDNTDDKVADVIMVEAYETFLCGGVRDMVANSKIVKGRFADFSEFGDNTLAILNAVGEAISPDDITEDDVLNCYYDLSGKLNKIVVTIDYGSGVIEEISAAGTDTDSLIISGKEYKCGASFALSPDSSSLKPGDEVTFWFNKDAKIGVIQKGISNTKISLLVDFGKTKGLDSRYQVRFFESNGIFSEYTLAEKVKTANGQIEAKNFEEYVGTVGNGKIKRQLVKYSLNDNKEVTRIVLADSTKDADGNYASDFFVYDGYDGTASKQYRTELYTFGLNLYTSGSTKVYVIPPESDRGIDEAYAIKSHTLFNNGNYKIVAYGINKYSPVTPAVIYESTTAASADPASSTRYFAVSSVTSSVDENGDEFVKLSGFHGDNSTKGSIGYLKAESIDVLKVGPGGSLVSSGDVIKYTTDATGIIKKAVLILDKSENKLHDMNNPNGAFPGTNIRYSYGDVVSNDGSYITIECRDTDGTLTKESYPIYRFTDSSVTGTANERTGEIAYKSARSADIFDRETYGSKCTKAFVNINGPWWIVGILYN